MWHTNINILHIPSFVRCKFYHTSNKQQNLVVFITLLLLFLQIMERQTKSVKSSLPCQQQPVLRRSPKPGKSTPHLPKNLISDALISHPPTLAQACQVSPSFQNFQSTGVNFSYNPYMLSD